MKILVLGGNGMLGHKLVQRWQNEFDVWTTLRGNLSDYAKFSIFEPDRTIDCVSAQDLAAVVKAIDHSQPDVIVNAIGVVKQVEAAKDTVAMLQVNAVFPHQLAEIAAKRSARLICISTDCVFDGAEGNYSEEDPPNASDLYGKSKNLGEVVGENCLTLRTSIIGREIDTDHGLVEWVMGNRGKTVNGYANAIFSGFPTLVLADIISDLIRNHRSVSGLYHLSSEPINKFDLLNLLKKSYALDIVVEPYEEFRIDRSLDSTKLRQATGFSPEPWGTMVDRMADDDTPYDAWRAES